MVQPSVPPASGGSKESVSVEQLEAEIRFLQEEISIEERKTEKQDQAILDARAALEAESVKWRERYEYPSSDFESFQHAVNKSVADGRVLEITADVTLDSEPVVLCCPARLLGRLVDSRRPVVQCNKLQIKGDKDVDIWMCGLEIAGFPMDEEHVTNTREMRTVADKYERQAREALSPAAKMSRGLDLQSRTAVVELTGSVEFHMSDCVIRGAGRNGIEVGGKCDMRGNGLELTGGLVMGISVLDDAQVRLERSHILDCRREGAHISTAGLFCFELSSISNCADGLRILGEQCTSPNVILGPEMAIRNCSRHGVRLNTGAAAAWAGGEISGCTSGAVHCQRGCILDGWQDSPPQES